MIRRNRVALLAVVVLLGALVVGRAAAQPVDPVQNGGVATCTTDGNGFCWINHGLGLEPLAVVATPVNPTTASPTTNFSQAQVCFRPADCDPGSHSFLLAFRVRAIKGNGAALANYLGAQVSWYAWRAGEPTTTTATTEAPTTTTTAATTTTTTAASCDPITITTGGTYSGCYTSTDAAVPAVTLSTTQPVTLDHAQIQEKGSGIIDTVTGVDLTVHDSVFTQTAPGAVAQHRAVELHQPAAFVFDHNQLIDTDGIWIGGGSAPIRVADNLASGIGRYPHPTSPNCCVQFLQLSAVNSPAIVVAWNHVTNLPGASGVEDVINVWRGGGTDSAHQAQIHHNLIDGAYPTDLAATDFTGGGILAHDGGAGSPGGHTVAHDNTVVSTTNYGVQCGGGTDCHLTSNLLVNDGSPATSTFGQAVSIHDATSSDATGNSYNWKRSPSSGQFGCWQSAYCSGGLQVATTEQQARDAWTASVPAAELPIGPRP
jgi:hypothetical protein